MREGWEAEAGNWATFARTPGHDHFHDEINLPALRDLLPGPAGATLYLGCGEGRLSRYLRSAGYRVAGADAAPTMVQLAAGLLIEAIREIPASDAVVAAAPGQRRWQRIPLFLHLRAVKPG